MVELTEGYHPVGLLKLLPVKSSTFQSLVAAPGFLLGDGQLVVS